MSVRAAIKKSQYVSIHEPGRTAIGLGSRVKGFRV